jgi:hypothetical protein
VPEALALGLGLGSGSALGPRGESVQQLRQLTSGRTLLPAKNGIFEPFMHLNDHFAKTGSGQT